MICPFISSNTFLSTMLTTEMRDCSLNEFKQELLIQIVHHHTLVSELTSVRARSSLSARSPARTFRNNDVVICFVTWFVSYELASVNKLPANGQGREENKEEVLNLVFKLFTLVLHDIMSRLNDTLKPTWYLPS